MIQPSATDRRVGYLIFALIFFFLVGIVGWMSVGGLTFVR